MNSFASFQVLASILLVLMAFSAISATRASPLADQFDDDQEQVPSGDLLAGSASGAMYNRAQEPRGLDSIANAKIQSSHRDLKTAAGHHYHGGHGASGWLKMGAHSGHKGAFGWHAKYPVGGKGRR